MSEEKVLTLRGKKAVWAPGGGSGPIDPKRLPEGYPYKEQSEVTLTFDPAVNTEAYGPLRKISDTALPLSGLIGANVKIMHNGEEHSAVVKESDITSCEGYYTVMAMADGIVGAQFMSVYEAQTEDSFGMDVPVGVYVAYQNESRPYVAEINAVSKTIHTMAPEFLPAGVGGGGDFIVTPTMSEDMTSCTLDKTVPEIWNAAKSGKRVIFNFSLFGESDIIPPLVLNRIHWQGGETTQTEMDFNCLVYIQNEALTFLNFRLEGRANSTTHNVSMTMKAVNMMDIS